MEAIDIPLEQLVEAKWNPNLMDDEMLMHLRESLRRYGLVENLVVRRLSRDRYEVLSGNQRLRLLKEIGFPSAPCVTVSLRDAEARLLAEALNHIRGQDDLGIRSELVREVLKAIPRSDVMAVLPDTAESLMSLSSMRSEDMATHLQNWQEAQGAKLRHIIFQMTDDRKAVVEETMKKMLPLAKEFDPASPNPRGVALYLLCQQYLRRDGGQ